jgi:hypothetical protein
VDPDKKVRTQTCLFFCLLATTPHKERKKISKVKEKKKMLHFLKTRFFKQDVKKKSMFGIMSMYQNHGDLP